jgi:glycoside/pentoside/hexuronide:cation symporter, GPH family
MSAGKLPLVTKLGFGAGDVANNLFFTTASLYLLYYYTDVLGLSPAVGGWIFAAALLWDAISDPIMGYLASRTRTRWGRYRPYLLFGAVPLAASWVLIFVPTGLTGFALILFALAAHMLFRTVYTIVGMPYLSLTAAMTADSGERGSLAAFRMVGATAAGLFVAFSTLKLAEALGQGDAMRGFLVTAILYGVVATALLFWTFATSFERPETVESLAARPDRKAMVAMLLVNRPLHLIALWLLANSMAGTLFGKTLPYVLKYDLGRADLIGPCLAAMTAAAMVSIPVWAWVARKTSKRTITIGGAMVGVIGYLALLAFPPTAGALLFANLAWIGFGAGAGYLAFWSMVPDTVEFGQFSTGTRAEGVVFGTIAFVQKAALGISVGILGELLSWIGYTANTVQTPETLAGMRMLLTVGPLIMLGLGIVAIWFYVIDARLHARIVRVLRRRHPGEMPI